MPIKIADIELYSVEELSEMLGIQERTVSRYLREGRLQGRKLARRWYVTAESLQKYFAQPETDQERHDPEHEESLNGSGATN